MTLGLFAEPTQVLELEFAGPTPFWWPPHLVEGVQDQDVLAGQWLAMWPLASTTRPVRQAATAHCTARLVAPSPAVAASVHTAPGVNPPPVT